MVPDCDWYRCNRVAGVTLEPTGSHRFVVFLEPKGLLALWWKYRSGETAMGLIILIVVGGVMGWLAAILMQIENDQHILQNMVAGIAGAVIVGLLVSSESVVGAVSADTLLWAVLGSSVAATLVHQVRCRLTL